MCNLPQPSTSGQVALRRVAARGAREVACRFRQETPRTIQPQRRTVVGPGIGVVVVPPPVKDVTIQAEMAEKTPPPKSGKVRRRGGPMPESRYPYEDARPPA